MYTMRPPISSYDSPITPDSLERMKDRLIGALEEPKIVDALGILALGLCNTAQMLKPMKYVKGEELGDSHPDSDWTDKNIIPLFGSNEFVVSGKQISPMPVQKDRIEKALAVDNSTRARIDDISLFRGLPAHKNRRKSKCWRVLLYWSLRNGRRLDRLLCESSPCY